MVGEISENGHRHLELIGRTIPSLEESVTHGWWGFIQVENYPELDCLKPEEVLVERLLSQNNALKRVKHLLDCVTDEGGPVVGHQDPNRSFGQQVLQRYVNQTILERNKTIVELNKFIP